MSLVDFGIEAPFRLPESPALLISEHAELAEFLNNIERPIGKITPDMAPACVIAAEISDEQRFAFTGLVEAASGSHRIAQEHDLGAQITAGVTPEDDSFVSLLFSKTNEHGFHSANNLLLVNERFLFAHSHVFKYFRAGRIEYGVRPVKTSELDRFNVVHHRLRPARELLRIAS